MESKNREVGEDVHQPQNSWENTDLTDGGVRSGLAVLLMPVGEDGPGVMRKEWTRNQVGEIEMKQAMIVEL